MVPTEDLFHFEHDEKMTKKQIVHGASESVAVTATSASSATNTQYILYSVRDDERKTDRQTEKSNRVIERGSKAE